MHGTELISAAAAEKLLVQQTWWRKQWRLIFLRVHANLFAKYKYVSFTGTMSKPPPLV